MANLITIPALKAANLATLNNSVPDQSIDPSDHNQTMIDTIDTLANGTILQLALVSGTTIKTVNSNSLLGSGDVAITPNATHTSEVTGATALTVNKVAITNKTLVTVASTDKILIADASDSDNLKNVTAQGIRDLKPTNFTYEISFNEVLDVLQRFTVATNITDITAYNVATLKYSINDAADVTVTLPFAGTISLTAGQRIVWKITYTTGTLAVLNLTATEL